MIANIGSTIVCVSLLIGFIYTMLQKDQAFHVEREQWQEERRDLLNRIQAGSYTEYKTQEIRLVKAQQVEEKKPNPIEPL